MSYERMRRRVPPPEIRRAIDIEVLADKIVECIDMQDHEYDADVVHEALLLAAIRYLGPAAYYQAMKGIAGTSQVPLTDEEEPS